MRLELWKAARFLPQTIQELPYRICYFLLSYAFSNRMTKVTVGFRNSLALSRIEPFLSDLDVTLICDLSERQAAIRLFLRVKSLLPVIGELNIYARESLPRVASQMNHCERARDPLIQQFRSELKLQADHIQAEQTVFLARMLEADWYGLLERPQTRRQKWHGHFKDLGITVPRLIDRDSILSALLVRAGFAISAEIVTSFVDYCQSKESLHLFPHVGHPAIQTLFFHRVCFTVPHTDLRERDWLVIDAQKKWEAWALHSVPNLDFESLKLHKMNMNQFTKTGQV